MKSQNGSRAQAKNSLLDRLGNVGVIPNVRLVTARTEVIRIVNNRAPTTNGAVANLETIPLLLRCHVLNIPKFLTDLNLISEKNEKLNDFKRLQIPKQTIDLAQHRLLVLYIEA